MQVILLFDTNTKTNANSLNSPPEIRATFSLLPEFDKALSDGDFVEILFSGATSSDDVFVARIRERDDCIKELEALV